VMGIIGNGNNTQAVGDLFQVHAVGPCRRQ
jgi:hypothetical protein